MMKANEIKKIEALGLTQCDRFGECNFCNEPHNHVYARMVGYDSAEIAYYICGKCALEKIRSGVQSCEQIVPPFKRQETKA